MATLQVRIHLQARTAFYPVDDDALGERLMGLLLDRLRPDPKRPPRPTLFLLQPDVVQVMDLVPVLKSGGDLHRAIASFSTIEGTETVALVGILDRRRRGKSTERVAAVFLEWPDGRWWMSVQAMDAQGLLVGEAPQIFSALNGDGKPRGLGGWFARARFESLKVYLEPSDQGMVH